jgi:plastocyanin
MHPLRWLRRQGHQVPRVFAVAAAILLGNCGISGPAHEGAPTDATVVEMSNGFNFSPAQVTIPVGGTVEWRNVSFFAHTVTADPAKAAVAADVQLPQGAAAFSSAEIPAGETYRHTFDVPGRYRYICRPHEDDGMAGTILVQ